MALWVTFAPCCSKIVRRRREVVVFPLVPTIRIVPRFTCPQSKGNKLGWRRRAISPGKTLAAPYRNKRTNAVTVLAVATANPSRTLSINDIFAILTPKPFKILKKLEPLPGLHYSTNLKNVNYKYCKNNIHILRYPALISVLPNLRWLIVKNFPVLLIHKV